MTWVITPWTFSASEMILNVYTVELLLLPWDSSVVSPTPHHTTPHLDKETLQLKQLNSVYLSLACQPLSSSLLDLNQKGDNIRYTSRKVLNKVS